MLINQYREHIKLNMAKTAERGWSEGMGGRGTDGGN